MQLPEIAIEESVEIDQDFFPENKLIVHNDNVNTFDWVIEALVAICKHSQEQAEQCSYFIHHKGKYAVKHGSLSKLRPMRNAIVERGINATIE